MYMLILKYWKPLLLAAVVLSVFGAWRYDRAAQFEKGKTFAYNDVSLRSKDAELKRTKLVLETERKQADEFAKLQFELEREKQNAENIKRDMRDELDRLRKYAANHGAKLRLPASDTPARASDDAASYGWQLFGECAAEYASMAETADKQRNDLAEWQGYAKTVVGEQ